MVEVSGVVRDMVFLPHATKEVSGIRWLKESSGAVCLFLCKGAEGGVKGGWPALGVTSCFSLWVVPPQLKSQLFLGHNFAGVKSGGRGRNISLCVSTWFSPALGNAASLNGRPVSWVCTSHMDSNPMWVEKTLQHAL